MVINLGQWIPASLMDASIMGINLSLETEHIYIYNIYMYIYRDREITGIAKLHDEKTEKNWKFCRVRKKVYYLYSLYTV